MDYLNKVSDQQFISKSKKVSKIIMKDFDPGNKIFRSHISKIINGNL